MNRDRVEGSWKQFSGQLQEQWGRFTGNDTRVEAGRREQQAGSLQERQGISKEEAERQISDFLERNRDWDISRRRVRP